MINQNMRGIWLKTARSSIGNSKNAKGRDLKESPVGKWPANLMILGAHLTSVTTVLFFY
jgi:hypothetical protein